MQNAKLQKLISLLLFTVILFNVGSIIYQQKVQYTSHSFWQNFSRLKEIYQNSQYVSKHPKGWIADERVNAYAGGAYIRGVAPELIAPDTPPMGRYLIGLSAVLFNNENIIMLISGIVSLVFIYLIGLQVFSSKTTALLLLALVTSEPIFKNQLIYSPLLDIIQLMFLSMCFYFFNRGEILRSDNKKLFLSFALSMFFLGCFISTKFFITGLTILVAIYVVLFLHKQKRSLVWVTLLLPIPILVLLLNYIRAFAYGYNVKAFLGIQKWIFLYHKTQLILPFSLWSLLLFNQWHVWFGKIPILHDPQWMFTWPIVTCTSFLTIISYIIKKITHRQGIEVIMIWVVCYLAFLSIGQITTRYFVILIPFLYMISLYGLEQIVRYRIIRHKENCPK